MKFFSNVLPVAGLALTLFLGASAQKATDVIRSIDFVADAAQSLEKDIKRVNDGDVDNEGKVRSSLSSCLDILSSSYLVTYRLHTCIKLIGQNIHTFAKLITNQLKTVFYDVVSVYLRYTRP